MTKETILYDNLKIICYELNTHTLITMDNIVKTNYEVTWFLKTDKEIVQSITKEEYDILYKELCNKVGARNL